MKKIKTIFEAVGKKCEKDFGVMVFDSYMTSSGKWENTGDNSGLFDDVIHISKDICYNYYLAWDNGDCLENIFIYRKKKGDC